MEQFSIKLSGVKQRISEENKMISSLSRLESDIWSVRSSLNFQVKSKQNIENVLKRLAQDVSDEETAMRNLKNALSNIYNQYEKTERNICGYALDHPITLEDIQKAITAIGAGIAVSAIWGPSTALIGAITSVIGGSGPATDPEGESIWERKFSKGVFEKDLWDKLDKAKEDNKYKKHYEMDDDGNWVDKTDAQENGNNTNNANDGNGQENNGDANDGNRQTTGDNNNDGNEQTDDQAAGNNANANQGKTDAQKRKDLLESITLWKGSKEASGSIFELGMEDSQTTDWGNYKHSGGFFNGKAGAEAYVGLGGIGAEVGISGSVFEYSGEVQAGSDMLGVHGEAGVTVGKAELSAGADVGLWDEDGSFNPQCGLSASAELIAGEIEGKVGVDVLGTDINVGGSLNYGIGAHADIGLQDGKLSLDIGASVGVGGSVQLEIDVSGTVDAVVDVAGDVYDKGVELATEAGEFIGDKLEDAGEFFEGVGEGISDGWNSLKDKWPW